MQQPRVVQGIALFTLALIAVTGVLAIFQPRPASAAVSSTLNFQARLENSVGAIVPDGTYNVEFKLYDTSSSSGSSQGSCTGDADCLWTETRVSSDQVRVVNGYLTVNLGSITSFPSTINWNQQLWLTMRIGGIGSPSWDAEMSPRIQLTAVPYAFTTGSISTTDGSGHTGTLSFPTSLTNSTDTITLPDASGTICLQSSSSCGFATGSGAAFLQGGNSFSGSTAGELGTNNNGALNFRTNNTDKLQLDTSGNLIFQQASTVNVASATTGTSLTIQGGAATSGTNTGGNLIFQGGAGASTGASGSVIVKSNTHNSTSAFQVQNASSGNLFTVDTTNTAIVLGNDGTPSALTIRGGAATSSNTSGSNITFDASNGTGVGGSGDFVFRTAASAATSVAYDNSSKGDDGGGGAVSSITVSHTVASQTNRVLIVAVTVLGGASLNSTSGVTYNGSNLTRLTTQACPAVVLPGQSCNVEIWYGLGIATGTHNIVATLSSGTGRISLAAASYYNVDQTTPFGTVAQHNGSTSPASQSIASSTTQLVFDALGSDNTITGSNSGGNVRKNDTGVQSAAIQDKAGSASSTTMGWTVPSADWAQIGFAINPVANTSADTLSDRLHITATGNVGINTSSPQYTLDVTGSGNFTTSVLAPLLDVASAGTLSIGTSTATTINIANNAAAHTIAIGSGVAAQTVTIGSTNTTSTLTLQGGSGGISLDATTGSITIGASANDKTISIGATGSTANTTTVHLADTTGAAQTITIGSTNTSSTTNIQGGTGNINLLTNSASASTIVRTSTNSTTAFQVQNTSASAILLVDTSAGLVGIGGITPARTLDVKGGTLTVATATSYAFGVGNTTQGDFTIGSDSSNIYLQSWNSKPLEINNQGNNIYLVPNSGSVGIGTASVNRTLDVNGNWGGNEVNDVVNDPANSSTRTISTPALVYHMRAVKTTGNSSATLTWNITGIPDVDGSYAYLLVDVGKVGSIGTSAQQCITFIRINSSANLMASALCTSVGNTADNQYRQFMVMRINGTWTVFNNTTSTTTTGSYPYLADLAEQYSSDQDLTPGDIVSTASGGYKNVQRSVVPSQGNLIGVVSTAPWQDIGSDEPGYPVALSGRVPVKVDLEGGVIHKGDKITSSSIPGVGMKANSAGMVIGTALEDYVGSCVGTIQVFVGTSYYNPLTTDGIQGATSFSSINVMGRATVQDLTVTGTATFQGNIVLNGHVITGGNAPAATALSASGIDGVGHVEGACIVNGNDTSGSLTLVAGFNNLASGAQCTVTFAKPFDSAPRPVVSATDKDGANVGVYTQTSTSQMTLYFSQIPRAGQQYNFNYWNPQ